MQRVVLRDVDLDSFTSAVGAERYAEGAAAAKKEAVIQMAWEASRQQLTGTVRDGSDIRTVSIAFRASVGFPLRYRTGYCSCAEGENCVHVAALFAAATDDAASQVPTPVARPTVLPWEQSLDSLLSDPAAGTAASQAPAHTSDIDAGPVPIALELSLVPDTPSSRYPAARDGREGWQNNKVKLQARLVQMGRSGNWIAGSLSWGRLDYVRLREEHPVPHLRLLNELLALYRASGPQRNLYAYSYGYGDQKTIDLSACESRNLWPVLEHAREIGLPMVYPGKLGPVPPPGTAELCLDVTAHGTSLHVTPFLRDPDDKTELTPLRFIGTEGHGVVYAPRGAGPERFRLARLTMPAHPRLQAMALAGEHLEVPAAGQAAFLGRYYPRLRRMATVTSSDGSFTPPVISEPKLVLHASYTDGHRADINWEWSYQVGDAELRAPLGEGEAGFRDPEAEARALARVQLPPGFPQISPERIAHTPARLRGLETMRFTTEALPLLSARGEIAVEMSGDVPDYREAGDSLRIGVSAAERPDDSDWFDLGITVTVESRPVPFGQLFVALANGQSHLLLPDGAYFSLDKPELATLKRLIEEARALQDQPEDGLRISRFQAGLWEELLGLGVVGRQAASWQRSVEGLLSVSSVEPVPPPECIRAQLRPYQLEGFSWLAFLWRHRLGGILADDMGLGKTLQTLALIAYTRSASSGGTIPPRPPLLSGGSPPPDPPGGPPSGVPAGEVNPNPVAGEPPFLIVAPTSVLGNWSSEAARFAPGLNVVVVGDTFAKRGESLSSVAAGADAVVTSYTLLRMDFESYGSAPWSGLILDEAQYVKNYQSKAYQCARKLPAPVKVAITGTPMENNLMELWSLLSITAPGLFPRPERFRDYYARPIERGGNAELLAQLRQRIRPLIKRRTKEQVAADLPEKQEQVLEVDLHARHRKLYQTHLQRERQKILGLLADVDKNRFTILRSLTLLRQLSLHAGLVDSSYEDVPSAKIDALLEQIDDVVGGGHRALVFSQFTRFLKLVRSALEAAGVPCCYLDGSTTNRPSVIAEFKEGTAPVFLISLKAGGFGLNLTEADYCFLLDPWWNPATEAQAVDRTHRIGQTRHVMVYRLISAGTIEEKVAALAARKAELFASVIDSDGAFGSTLTADDIRALLT